jgi:hypothetical protein
VGGLDGAEPVKQTTVADTMESGADSLKEEEVAGRRFSAERKGYKFKRHRAVEVCWFVCLSVLFQQ